MNGPRFQRYSPRYVCCASLPLLDVNDAVAEIRRGFRSEFPRRLPADPAGLAARGVGPHVGRFGETGLVIGFHIGTEPHTAGERTGVYHRGRGGAVLNYLETTYGGQRSVTQLIACSALDRHHAVRSDQRLELLRLAPRLCL